jgi:hypothetical protein
MTHDKGESWQSKPIAKPPDQDTDEPATEPLTFDAGRRDIVQ